jgi:hypothetical protein
MTKLAKISTRRRSESRLCCLAGSLILVAAMSGILHHTEAFAAPRLPLPPSGPFTVSWRVSTVPGQPHTVRIKGAVIRAVRGRGLLGGGGRPGKPETFLHVYCDYRTPCSAGHGESFGMMSVELGSPAKSRVELREHETTLVTPRTVLYAQTQREAYVRRPESSGFLNPEGRLVSVAAYREKFYTLRPAGSRRVSLKLSKEDCVTTPVPSTVPPGEAPFVPHEPDNGFVKVPCPTRWQAGQGILICLHEGETLVVPTGCVLSDPL